MKKIMLYISIECAKRCIWSALFHLFILFTWNELSFWLLQVPIYRWAHLVNPIVICLIATLGFSRSSLIKSSNSSKPSSALLIRSLRFFLVGTPWVSTALGSYRPQRFSPFCLVRLKLLSEIKLEFCWLDSSGNKKHCLDV